EGRRPVWTYDDASAGESLAQVVVGVTLQPQRDAPGHERAERLSVRPGQRDVDRAVGEALALVALGHLVPEDRADGAVDVAHLELGAHRLRPLPGGLPPQRQ